MRLCRNIDTLMSLTRSMVGPHKSRKSHPLFLSESGKCPQFDPGCGRVNDVNRDQEWYDERLGLWVSKSPAKGNTTTAGIVSRSPDAELADANPRPGHLQWYPVLGNRLDGPGKKPTNYRRYEHPAGSDIDE